MTVGVIPLICSPLPYQETVEHLLHVENLCAELRKRVLPEVRNDGAHGVSCVISSRVKECYLEKPSPKTTSHRQVINQLNPPFCSRLAPRLTHTCYILPLFNSAYHLWLSPPSHPYGSTHTCPQHTQSSPQSSSFLFCSLSLSSRRLQVASVENALNSPCLLFQTDDLKYDVRASPLCPVLGKHLTDVSLRNAHSVFLTGERNEKSIKCFPTLLVP